MSFFSSDIIKDTTRCRFRLGTWLKISSRSHKTSRSRDVHVTEIKEEKDESKTFNLTNFIRSLKLSYV